MIIRLIKRLTLRPFKNVQFCPRSRKTIPPRAGEIGQKGAFFIGLTFTLGLIFLLSCPALPAVESQPSPAHTDGAKKNDSGPQELIDRLVLLDEPVSREGTGILIVQAPGERYRLQFRLIARGPEALRLEIFDPFGRPMIYLVSFLREIRLFSIPQKKEIPFILPSSGPWSAFPQISVSELLKIFWGRIPLFPYDTYQSSKSTEKGRTSIKYEFRGSVYQEIWTTTAPFSLTKSRITSPSREGAVEILFSDFSEKSGSLTPMRCEIKDGTGEHALTLRYETLVPRFDIPEELFKLPEFSDVLTSEKEKKP